MRADTPAQTTTPTAHLVRVMRRALAFVVCTALLLVAMPLTGTAVAMGASPELVFVATAGSSASDEAFSVAVDADGNSYLSGYFADTADFDGDPATTGDQRTSTGFRDIYIASYDPSGLLRWVTTAGGDSDDGGLGIDVDGNNIYMTGWFSSTADFDANPATAGDQRMSQGGRDLFVASYDTNGNFRWVTTAGDTGFDQGWSIEAIGNNTYVSGIFEGTVDFDDDPATTGDQRISQGGTDAFVASYDTNGNFRWVTTAGGTGGVIARSIAVDANNNSYITGDFSNTADFDGNPATTGDQRTSPGFNNDIFLASYDGNGNFRWVTTAGGTGSDRGWSVAVDTDNNAYITGHFSNTADFDGNQRTSAGSRDIFIASYDTNGNFRSVTTVGSTSDDEGKSIAIDPNNNVHIMGTFRDTVDFDGDPATADGSRTTTAGSNDIFIASYDTNGNFGWVTTAGGPSQEQAWSIAVDENNNTYGAGYFSGTADFDGNPATAGDQRTSAGNLDGFLVRLAVLDVDGDGFEGVNGDGQDCDDGDTSINPSASETAYNGIDEDCDGGDLDDVDGDGSASTAATGGTPDCDDDDPAINPSAVDTPGDGIDQDCDGVDASVQTCNGLTVTIDMNTGATGFGTAGDDVIFGTPGPDVIDGMGGDDTICGEAGDDNISGSAGVDFIYGGEGNDTLSGGPGNDRIRGQQDIDMIDGGDGNDFLYGGVGGDTINGDDGNDTIGGFGGADLIDAGPGNDTVFGGFGGDTIHGGPGNDTLAGLIGNDTINGDDGDDSLTGDNGQDTLSGGNGNDQLFGGNSLDNLLGGPGDDELNGGKSDDNLSGGSGTDTCVGNKQTIADTADTTCETTFGVP